MGLKISKNAPIGKPLELWIQYFWSFWSWAIVIGTYSGIPNKRVFTIFYFGKLEAKMEVIE